MKFKDKMNAGEPLYGLIVTLGLPSICEMLSSCGFDWLWIDMEHSPLSLKEVQEMAQATSKGCAALVRVPVNNEEWIKRVLDLGVEGLILPHVNSADQVRSAVRASYYPPEGNRSLGMTRASQYGMDTTYKFKANANRLLFVQIEDREGVDNIEEIVQVPGLDGILIGPYDLSGSYGKLGQISDAQVVKAVEKVLHTCKHHAKPIGIFAKHPDDAKRYLELGFQLIATGIDIHYLWTGAKRSLDLLKNLQYEEREKTPASSTAPNLASSGL